MDWAAAELAYLERSAGLFQVGFVSVRMSPGSGGGSDPEVGSPPVPVPRAAPTGHLRHRRDAARPRGLADLARCRRPVRGGSH